MVDFGALTVAEGEMTPRAIQKIKRRERGERAMVMRLKGMTYPEIARKEKVSVATIRNDVEKMEWEHVAVSQEKIDRVRARQIGRIELLMNEAWNAWEASKGDEYEYEDIEGGKGGGMNITRRKVKASGDPAILNTIRWAITEINKMSGLHAAQKHELVTRHLDVNKLLQTFTDAQLQRVALGEKVIDIITDEFNKHQSAASSASIISSQE